MHKVVRPQQGINTQERRHVADMIHRFLDGSLDSLEFTGRLPRPPKDAAVATLGHHLYLWLRCLENLAGRGLQAWDESRFALRRHEVFLRTDLPLPRRRGQLPWAPFADEESMKQACAAAGVYPVEDMSPPPVARAARDRGARIIRNILAGRMTFAEAGRAWPVTAGEDVDSCHVFADRVLEAVRRDVFEELLRHGGPLTRQSAVRQRRLREVLERLLAFLETNLPYAPVTLPKESIMWPITTGLLAFIGGMIMVGVVCLCTGSVLRAWWGERVTMICSFGFMLVVGIIGMVLGNARLRNRRWRCLTEGRLRCWPFTSAEQMREHYSPSATG